MKIFYAIQATGNGHISRAIQLYPYLKQFGEVDFFLSGSNMGLQADIPVKFRSKGISLFYKKGGLDYLKMIRNFNPVQLYRDAKSLPLHDYDIIINDFEPVTAFACWIQKKKSVQFGHQASFQSKKTPRPNKKDFIGELVLKFFGKSTHYVGLHFEQYDDFIFPPVIKTEIIDAKPTNKEHITVYLPSVDAEVLASIFKKLPEIQFQLFTKNCTELNKSGNITYFPVNQIDFNESMIHCQGIITGAGFETPAEAIYLNKKLLCIPISGQYEQKCNGASLKELGVTVLDKIDIGFENEIKKWVIKPNEYPEMKANDVIQTLTFLFEKLKNNE